MQTAPQMVHPRIKKRVGDKDWLCQPTDYLEIKNS